MEGGNESDTDSAYGIDASAAATGSTTMTIAWDLLESPCEEEISYIDVYNALQSSAVTAGTNTSAWNVSPMPTQKKATTLVGPDLTSRIVLLLTNSSCVVRSPPPALVVFWRKHTEQMRRLLGSMRKTCTQDNAVDSSCYMGNGDEKKGERGEEAEMGNISVWDLAVALLLLPPCDVPRGGGGVNSTTGRVVALPSPGGTQRSSGPGPCSGNIWDARAVCSPVVAVASGGEWDARAASGILEKLDQTPVIGSSGRRAMLEEEVAALFPALADHLPISGKATGALLQRRALGAQHGAIMNGLGPWTEALPSCGTGPHMCGGGSLGTMNIAIRGALQVTLISPADCWRAIGVFRANERLWWQSNPHTDHASTVGHLSQQEKGALLNAGVRLIELTVLPGHVCYVPAGWLTQITPVDTMEPASRFVWWGVVEAPVHAPAAPERSWLRVFRFRAMEQQQYHQQQQQCSDGVDDDGDLVSPLVPQQRFTWCEGINTSKVWTPDHVDRSGAARALLDEAVAASGGGQASSHVPLWQDDRPNDAGEEKRDNAHDKPSNEVLAGMYHEATQRHGQQDCAEFWWWMVYNQFSTLSAGVVSTRVRWGQDASKLDRIVATASFDRSDWERGSTTQTFAVSLSADPEERPPGDESTPLDVRVPQDIVTRINETTQSMSGSEDVMFGRLETSRGVGDIVTVMAQSVFVKNGVTQAVYTGEVIFKFAHQIVLDAETGAVGELVAVILRRGEDGNGGHYCVAVRQECEEDDLWVLVDDSPGMDCSKVRHDKNVDAMLRAGEYRV